MYKYEKVFVDTNIFVNYFNGKNTDLLEMILRNFKEVCVNDIVFSELTINLLKSKTNLKA